MKKKGDCQQQVLMTAAEAKQRLNDALAQKVRGCFHGKTIGKWWFNGTNHVAWGYVKIATELRPIEIVSFPSESGDVPVRYVSHYHRVAPIQLLDFH